MMYSKCYRHEIHYEVQCKLKTGSASNFCRWNVWNEWHTSYQHTAAATTHSDDEPSWQQTAIKNCLEGAWIKLRSCIFNSKQFPTVFHWSRKIFMLSSALQYTTVEIMLMIKLIPTALSYSLPIMHHHHLTSGEQTSMLANEIKTCTWTE